MSEENRPMLSANSPDRTALKKEFQQQQQQEPLQSSSNHSNTAAARDTAPDNGDDEGEMSYSSVGLIKLVLVAAATAATLGYDVGIMAAAIQPIEREMQLTSVQKELAMGSLNFVAALGALLGGSVANQYGRKPTVILCCWIFVVGTLCMALAPGYWLLLLGRIITDVGVGVSFVAAPDYLSEVAPSNMRGQLNTVFEVAINGGILWAVLPESPRWLVMKNQSAAASRVLADLGHTPRQVMRTVSSIEEEHAYFEDEMLQAASDTTKSFFSACCCCLNYNSWSPGMNALGFWQQVTGTEAVLYYSADFLEHAGLESPTQRLLGNVFVGLCKLIPELIAMQLVDKIGRRPHMLASAISLVVTMAWLACAFYFNWNPMFVVLLLCAVMASFSIGLGPFTFLVASESLGLNERAWGVTVAAAVNRMTSGTVALTAVSLYQSLGSSGFFFLYAFVGLCSLPFYFTYLPETTGQSLEELSARNRSLTASGRNTPMVMRSPAPPPAAIAPHLRSSHNENYVEMQGELA